MNYTLVGGFVIVLAAVLIGGLLWIASGGALRKHYDLFIAIEEESVAGLSLDAPVKYNGVEVGKVRDIQLDPADPQRVRLTFAIERGTPVKEDTEAVLKTQGLTGIAYVELVGGSRTAALLVPTEHPPYPLIRTKPSLSARLENVLTTVLAKLDRTTGNIDALLSDENRAAVKSTLADIASVAHTIASRRNVLDAGIMNAARTFDNSARATADLGPVIKRISSAADAVAKMGDDVSLAGTSVAKTAGSVGADTRRFATETLPQVQRLLGELNDLSNSLRRLSEQTARDPAGLLRGHGVVPEGPGESTTEPRQP